MKTLFPIFNMFTIGLVVNEAADLPEEIIEKNQIVVVPVKMEWPEVEILPGQNTFQKMREAEKRGIKTFGRTSQPSPKDFLTAFEKQLEIFEKVLCVTITSKLSGTYNSALQAKNFLGQEREKRVFVVDSLNASCGTGLLALRAIDFVNQGKDIEGIVKELEKLIPQIHLYGMFEEVKWLESSGRISHILANWVRRMRKIGVRPIIEVKKGVVTAGGITKAKDVPTGLFRQLKIKTEKLRSQDKKIRIAITHGDNLEIAQKLKKMVEDELTGTESAYLNLIDDVLGVLVGPNALILAWCEI